MPNISLRDYEKGKHWKDLRNKILWKEPDLVCEICGKRRWEVFKRGPHKGEIRLKSRKAFNIHHKHYDTIFHESREDLMVLCTRCHQIGHELHKNVSTPIYAFLYDEFCKRTGWEHKFYPRVKQKYVNKKMTPK